MSIRHFITSMLLAGILAAVPAHANEPTGLSDGQTIYAPVYSHVYHGNLNQAHSSSQIQLSAMLSIRNTDLAKAITILSVDYYGTDGKIIRHFLTKPRKLAPLASMDTLIQGKDKSGGAGANFLVTWEAHEPVNPPLVETVHAYFFGTTTLAFVTGGVSVARSNH